MPFNADDYTKAPWAAGCMTLTHDECVEVKGKIAQIIEEFVPDNYTPFPTEMYIISTYNDMDWNKAINAETYVSVNAYNPEYNTQGIDENGIIPEPEQPTEEETPAEEPETPVEDVEEATEGETIPEEETAPEEAAEAPAAE